MSNVPSDFDQLYNEQHSNHVTLLWLIFAIIAATILGVILIYMYCKRTRVSVNGLKDLEQQSCPVVQTKASSCSGPVKTPPPSSPGSTLVRLPIKFKYEELAQATESFSDANLLGQGGFGCVYKGVLRNRKEVAIKKLKIGGQQGKPEFRAEVKAISQVHHRHLVSLVGYCKNRKRMLVYEFVPNGTLKSHLHGERRPTMSWPNRMKVALGSAKGLEYLHEDCKPKIIHRDIKADNILLDQEFVAKVADFGLAKFIPDFDTHVSTGVKGTFGYLDPEYASSGKLTDKSDVFSFGVVLLELITGLYPIIKVHSLSVNLAEHARPLLEQALENGKFDGLVDPKLQKDDYNSSEMTRMIACASACVRHRAQLRPQMRLIVRALEGSISMDHLKEGIKPGHSMVDGSYGSKDLQKFRKLALEGGQSTG